MAKRLQVILQDPEYRAVQRAAKSRHLTVAAWVRQAIAEARRSSPEGDARRKLGCVREAVRHSYPSGDIEVLLREIDSGYSPSIPE